LLAVKKPNPQTLRRRQAQKPTSESTHLDSEFGLIASLLPTGTQTKEEKELDTETDEILRGTSIIVLRLLYAQAQSQTEMMDRELEMLKAAPPSPTMSAQVESQDERVKKREEEASMWRLDAPRPSGGPDGKGPLMDSSGRVRYQLLSWSLISSHNHRSFDPSPSCLLMQENDNG
jgi:immunoglobulin-binding protein 1